MGYREIILVEVTEVLRRWQAGHAVRRAARECGCDRKTLRRDDATATMLALPRDPLLTDEQGHAVATRVQAKPVAALAFDVLDVARVRAVLEAATARLDDDTLRKSRFDNSHEVEMRKLVTVDVLVLDDFALEPMSADESRDVYQLPVERTGRASMIVTSNRDTGEWLAMFDEPLRAQSALDRYVNAAFDLVGEGESYRPRLKPSLETVSTSPGPTDAKRPARGRRR